MEEEEHHESDDNTYMFVLSLRGKTKEEMEKAIDERYPGVDTSEMKKILLPFAQRGPFARRDQAKPGE